MEISKNRNQMELQTLGARIFAIFLFISILLLEASPAATAVSRINNGVGPASANKGKKVIGQIEASAKNGTTSVSRNGKGTTPATANKGKTAIGKTKSSANNGKIPIGKIMGSANRGKKVVAANLGKTPIGKIMGSANRSTKKVSANHGKTVVSNNSNNGTKAVPMNKGKTEVSANHGGAAAVLKINNGKKAVSTNNGETAASQNKINNIKTISVDNNGETPLSQNNSITSGPMKRQQEAEQFIPEFNWEQQQYLEAHNDLRQENGIPPLKWDAGLTAHARSWAMERRNDCKYRDHSNGMYGENSFWMQYKDFNPTDVVQNWFSEKELFDHTRNLCKCEIEKEDCECGHYLNVIGKTTTKLGCSGYVYCSNQKGVIVYCSYFPPTNYSPRLNPKNPPPAARRLLSFI